MTKRVGRRERDPDIQPTGWPLYFFPSRDRIGVLPRLNELEVLHMVCSRLEAADIAYMLTGSLAMNYYAQPRMTRDIDLVVALGGADTQRLPELFAPDFYVDAESVSRAVYETSMFNLLHLESVVKVDMIVRKDSPYRRGEFERRRRIELEGFSAWIVSLEDLILSKLIWAKPSRSELQLRDVKNLLAAGPERAYLRQWANALCVESLLEECLES